ncbi:DDB1 and CUL4 associated factor 15 [Nesidiocoris tenuis]|uniref:DDB1 and CUL4 associated factor 15 n=1 Tax=Nesidiocoris tenuis TaxID=355587 RepID=A0ABN7BD62_9HEMI|nr:DDB1 and CUL4 associated factor 15 [Nesidiocoris tenuis]
MSLRKYRGNLLQKLYNRQLFGEFVYGVPLSHEPSRQLFEKVPSRLVFRLRDTIPNLGNHILMGPTRCGQILLTYTYSADSTSDFSPTMPYRYRLHFWVFRPGRPAAKIGEVQLFDGAVVTQALDLGIAQWPNDNNRLLVYGTCNGLFSPDEWEWGSDPEKLSSTYITVTTLPCLTGCENCRAVAASFDEEEMAAGWESGIGLSCMRHGLTVHTHYTAPHVDTLDPEFSLAPDNRVILNTGAFLHALSVNVECSGRPLPSPSHSSSNIVVEPILNRLSHSFLHEWNYSTFVSEDWSCNMVQLFIDRTVETGMHWEMNQLPHSLRLALLKHVQKPYTTKCKLAKKGTNAKNCGDWVFSFLNPGANRPKQRWFSSTSRSHSVSLLNKSKSTRRPLDKAENVYDFMESDESSCEPKFKLYRRRCLADKMYEFRSDEECVMGSENIRPHEPSLNSNNEKVEMFENMGNITSPKKAEELPLPPPPPPIQLINKSLPALNPTLKAILADWDFGGVEVESDAEKREKVITTFMTGIGGKSKETSSSPPARRSDGKWSPLKPHNKKGQTVPVRSIQTRSMRQQQKPFELTDEMRNEMARGFGHQPVLKCTTKFTRRYIEVDQEITSTITDIEDDVSGSAFHCVLPITAHGSSYSQMEMIANAKATKLGIMCAVVRQESLDIEQLCFKAAQFICKMEGFRFWFCSDYDTEVVRVCHLTGDVLGVLFIRMNAEQVKGSAVDDAAPHPDREDVRNFYETQCLYIWSPSKSEVFLEGFKSLEKVPMVTSRFWCPAVKEAKNLRAKAPSAVLEPPPPRAMTHKVPCIEGVVFVSAENIIDHENLIGFRRS